MIKCVLEKDSLNKCGRIMNFINNIDQVNFEYKPDLKDERNSIKMYGMIFDFCPFCGEKITDI